MEGYLVREVEPLDWNRVRDVLVEWWDGRDLTDLLPRLFFLHFRTTSWVIDKDGELVAFLVGFLCPAHQDEAYVHFVGVDPRYRGRGLARRLYERFFEAARVEGRSVVRAITSPVNAGSIDFHRHLGFAVVPGDSEIGGISVWRDYDGPGEHRVRFEREVA